MTQHAGAQHAGAQQSLFSVDLAPPQLSDLGGLLAAHGQITLSAAGARLSILLAERWRAEALQAECRMREIAAEVVEVTTQDRDAQRDVRHVGARANVDADLSGPVGLPGPTLLRTERTDALASLAQQWSRGAIKAVPPGLTVDAGVLRLWAIAAGRTDPRGYLLGLDRHAVGTHAPLAAASERAGLGGSVVGVQSGKPALRLTGMRRLTRAAEMMGTPPAVAPAGVFPAPRR